jgi:4-amino-4-deoxy-L-arabinose transferase-like glycosyltransferase
MRQSRYIFWTILALALLLRVVAAVVIDRHVTKAGRTFLIEGDANGYWELAQHIATGEDYSIYQPPRLVERTPGFPLLLAVSIKLFGNNVFAASLLMAVVGAGCCWLTWILARTLFDETTANWAMLSVAVSPLQIGSNVQILSEAWFSFGLLICLLALARLILQPLAASYGRTAFANGVLTGLTVLIRPGWILWTGLSAFLVLLFGKMCIRRRFLSGALLGLGCFVALLPWAWRNHEVTGHWIFTSLWSGPSLYDGLHEGATGASDMQFLEDDNLFAKMSEFDVNEHYNKLAVEFVLSHPGRTIQLAFIKAGRYLSPSLNAEGFSGGPFSLFCLAWYSAWSALILLGIWNLRHRLSVVALLVSPFLQFLLVHMVFVGSIRYRLPVEFPLSILAAHGIVLLRQKWNHRGRRAQDSPSGVS